MIKEMNQPQRLLMIIQCQEAFDFGPGGQALPGILGCRLGGGLFVKVQIALPKRFPRSRSPLETLRITISPVGCAVISIHNRLAVSPCRATCAEPSVITTDAVSISCVLGPSDHVKSAREGSQYPF
jgi:hypothetical protein